MVTDIFFIILLGTFAVWFISFLFVGDEQDVTFHNIPSLEIPPLPPIPSLSSPLSNHTTSHGEKVFATLIANGDMIVVGWSVGLVLDVSETPEGVCFSVLVDGKRENLKTACLDLVERISDDHSGDNN